MLILLGALYSCRPGGGRTQRRSLPNDTGSGLLRDDIGMLSTATTPPPRRGKPDSIVLPTTDRAPPCLHSRAPETAPRCPRRAPPPYRRPIRCTSCAAG